MAWLFKRGSVYEARWTVNGKQHRKSTGIKIAGGPGYSAAQAKRMAQQAADSMEQMSTGGIPLNKALNAIRAVAEVQGVAGSVPTVRQYLATIRERKQDRSQNSRARAHAVFEEFLGDDADARIDLITPQRCREFVRWAARTKGVSMSTVKLFRMIISAAFNQAVDVDDILVKNPMHRVNVREEYVSVMGKEESAPMKRQPFTVEEIHRLIKEMPAPWCDMVAVSWYCMGLRLSDVCLMRWDAVDLDKGTIHIEAEIKTGQPRDIVICDALPQRLERIKGEQTGDETYLFPAMAAQYEVNQSATISTRFTSMLQAMGIIGDPIAEKKKGARHRMSDKSFHSIRHAVVSVLRSNPAFTPDMVRDAVGHSSEAVEQGYYTATMAQRAQLSNALMQAVEHVGNPGAEMPPYPATA